MKSMLVILLAVLGLSGVSLGSLGLLAALDTPVGANTAKAAATGAKLAQPASQDAIGAANSAQGQPQASPQQLYAERLLALTNNFRKQHGKPPVQFDPHLQRAAQERTNAGYSHFIQGQDCGAGARSRGFHGSGTGENIAAGQRSPEEAVNAWINYPGHRMNMLGNWQVCGMAKANGSNRWIQIFGHY